MPKDLSISKLARDSFTDIFSRSGIPWEKIERYAKKKAAKTALQEKEG